MTPNKACTREIAEAAVDGTDNQPPRGEQRLVAQLHKRLIDGDGADRAADRGDNRENGAPPCMQRPARHHRLDHFLRDQREEQRHPDVVDQERQVDRELEVTLGARVRPHQRDDDADGYGETVIEDEAPDATDGTSSRSPLRGFHATTPSHAAPSSALTALIAASFRSVRARRGPCAVAQPASADRRLHTGSWRRAPGNVARRVASRE